MMSAEDIMSKARDIVTKLRTAEKLIVSGKLDEGVKLFRETTKEAKDAGLLDNYMAIIRKIRRLIRKAQLRQARAANKAS